MIRRLALVASAAAFVPPSWERRMELRSVLEELREPSPILVTEGPKLRSDAWLDNLMSIPRSRILRRVGSHVTATTAWAAAVLYANEVAPGSLPVVSPTPLQVLGTAISLLLAFRTSQSYDRFWNGRDVWSDVWSSCRGLKRSIVTWRSSDALDDVSKVALGLTALYPATLIHHLRSELDDPSTRRDLEKLLGVFFETLDTPQSPGLWLAKVSAVDENLPLAIIDVLAILQRDLRSDRLRRGLFDDGEFAIANYEAHLDRLGRSLSNAEKIVVTPVPPSYTRHTSRLLSIWALALPLTFANLEPPFVVLPFVIILSWALFALEEIGKIIEEPFGTDSEDIGLDLPLEKYASRIAKDVLNVQDHHDALAPLLADLGLRGAGVDEQAQP
ncbi:hypothetical protein CTAYLR_010215 [Chrysophaeum taylorii]|uniref:Uncharacterized protein n=1 Tax=Chrysophaeum taylorii TaxID=2483200 RepID=A0AAD7XEX2_9STRA|nr:hypothetical protein CTAYLR_010215 [Chrysophaeum taylorii]